MKTACTMRFGMLFLAGVLLITGCSKKNDWRITLREDGSEPYDLRVFTRLLKDAVGSDHYENPEYNLTTALQDAESKTLYVYAGYYPYYNEEELTALKEFTAAGNSVLIINNNFPQIVVDSLCNLNLFENAGPDSAIAQTISLPSISDSIVQIQHAQTGKEGEVYFKSGVNIYRENWNFFNDSLILLTGAQEKWWFNHNRAAAIDLPMKNGHFILISEALPLTNYHLRNENNFILVNDLLADIEFEAVIFDQSRSYSSAQGSDFNRSPLFYFFRFESFRYAWMILLIAVLLYLLFNFKRKVRNMPLLPDKTNKSLLYVNTVSLMYYKNKAHLHIARMAAEVFLFEVRRKYRIKTSKLDNVFIEALATKTQKHRSEAKLLTEKIISLKELAQLSEDGFLHFFEVLNAFKKAMKQK